MSSILQRAQSEDLIEMVADEFGSPIYALHLADAILSIAAVITHAPDANIWGSYHLANQGGASWHQLAECVFNAARRHGSPAADVRPVKRADFELRSARPANAQLDCTKLQRAFAISLQTWQAGVTSCVERILSNRN